MIDLEVIQILCCFNLKEIWFLNQDVTLPCCPWHRQASSWGHFKRKWCAHGNFEICVQHWRSGNDCNSTMGCRLSRLDYCFEHRTFARQVQALHRYWTLVRSLLLFVLTDCLNYVFVLVLKIEVNVWSCWSVVNVKWNFEK